MQIQVFPFRLNDENMKAHADSPWFNFWANMKEGSDAFDQWRLPPVVSVCDGRYSFERAETGSNSGGIQACAPTLTGIHDQDQWLRDVPAPSASGLKIDEPAYMRPRMTFPLANAAEGPQG